MKILFIGDIVGKLAKEKLIESTSILKKKYMPDVIIFNGENTTVVNGKITSFRETDDGRYLIELKGIIRFKNIEELNTNKKYRVLNVNYENFLQDLKSEKEDLKFSDL